MFSASLIQDNMFRAFIPPRRWQLNDGVRVGSMRCYRLEVTSVNGEGRHAELSLNHHCSSDSTEENDPPKLLSAIVCKP